MLNVLEYLNQISFPKLLILMYMKHLQRVLTLERPEFMTTFVSTLNKTISFNYTISEMKYQACFIQPSRQILEIYKMGFHSESHEDLSINIPDHHYMKYL